MSLILTSLLASSRKLDLTAETQSYAEGAQRVEQNPR